MSIPLRFPNVMQAFQKPLRIETYKERYVLDAWEQELVKDRQILAIVLQPTQEEVKLYSEGNLSEGVISITTRETLNFSDVGDAEAEQNAERLQDYALYKGYRFRLHSNLFMLGNTDIQIYWAVRFYQ